MQILIRHSQQIIDTYTGQGPVHLFLKSYLSGHKQLGSRDRKIIAEVVYLYFRLKPLYPNSTLEVLLQVALAKDCIKHPKLKEIVQHFEPQHLPSSVLPDMPALSDGLSLESYITTLFDLPWVFFRTMKPMVKGLEEMKQAGIILDTFDIPGLTYKIYAVQAATPLQDFMKSSEYVIQDFHSQQCIIEAVQQIDKPSIHTIWDVCSGAGGKAILLKQFFPQSLLYASDIRPNILHNLEQRIHTYGLKKVETIIADITKGVPMSLHGQDMNLVVADVPCTGSGTWARTPEQFAAWDNALLPAYVQRQEAMMKQLLPFIKKGAYLVYITCSVFKAENEGMVDYILKESPAMQLQHSMFLDGTLQHSDHMFYAVFQKQ